MSVICSDEQTDGRMDRQPKMLSPALPGGEDIKIVVKQRRRV